VRGGSRLLLAVGVVVFVVGVVLFARAAQFVADAEHATGTVIDLSRERDSDGRVSLYPVVRFTTADGQTIEFVNPSTSNPPSETPGDRVAVLYDPDDPYDAQLSGFLHNWLPPTTFSAFGAFFVAAAWYVRRRDRVSEDRLVPWLWRGALAVGVVLLLVGTVLSVQAVRFVADAEHARGTVIDLSRESDSEGAVSLYPVVRFTTTAGDTIEFVSRSSSPLAESPGDHVEVLYNPAEPYDARLVSRVVSNLTVRSRDTGVCRLLRGCCSETVTREG
jgi:Protein of unknown function (DUF3592)